MSRFKILMLITLLITPSMGEAATYYVATTGNPNNNCVAAQNPATPKNSVRAAMLCVGVSPGLGAGQTIVVKPGTYPEELMWNEWPSGASWDVPFTLKAETRGTVTLRPTTGACPGGTPCYSMEIMDLGQECYCIIDGFVLDGSFNYSDGIRYHANHVRVQYTEIYNPRASCILGAGNNGEFLNMTWHSCSARDMAYHNGAGHNVMYIGGSYNRFDYITVYNCKTNELTFYNGGGGGPPSSFNMLNHAFLNGCGVGLYSGSGNVVANSLIMNNRRSPVWGGGSYDNSGAGVVVAYGCSNCMVLNNTIFNNPDDNCVYINPSGNTNVVVQNNICWQNGGGIVNEMGGGGGALISNNLTIDPRFMNPTTSTSFYDRSANNFRLRDGSPATGQGLNLASYGVVDDIVGVLRQGNKYDIGAYVSVSSADITAPAMPQGVRLQ